MARLFQFSIRGLLWAVTMLAVGIAALINANYLWQGAIWGLVLYALVAAVLLVVYRREEKRAYWLGFSIFGWMYLVLFLTSLVPMLSQNWVRTDPLKHDYLLPTHLASLAHQYLLPQSRRDQQIVQTAPGLPPGAGASDGSMGMAAMPGMPMGPGSGMMPGAGGPPGMMGGGPGGMMPGGYVPTGSGTFTILVTNPNYVPIENFTHIFHGLFLLLVAAIGGKTCQIIYRTRPAAEQ